VAAQIQDVLVLLGLLLVAVGCLWYARMGLQEEDAVLVVGGILAAAGFALAAPVYWWLVW
jgi:drug/metabolite transporter (DMT)-like permease